MCPSGGEALGGGVTGEGFAIRFSPNPSSIPVGCDSG